MSKRLTDREKLLFKLDRLTDPEVEEVLEYVSSMETSRPPSAGPHSPETPKMSETPEAPDLIDSLDDDLLASLSAQHENRRARQVFEWESTRRGVEAQTLHDSSARR